MYTTGAHYPGIMAGQYVQQAGPYGQPDRSGLLANLRRPGPPASYPAPYNGQQQQQSMQEMQQQHQIEMEIARMQLQNLELQKQLLMQAAANAQAQQQQHQHQQQPAVRRERTSTAPGQARTFTDRAPDGYIDRDWRSNSPQYESDEGVARRDALQTLERAQRSRHASAGGGGLPFEGSGGLGGRGNRLSFGGMGDGVNLIESARARNRHSFEPPSSPVQSTPPVMSTPPPPQSIKAFVSTTSPPRPTLVLSKPGEAFPQTSPSPPRKGHHVKSDSHSSSASSLSDHSSSESEPHSFESAATSVGGNTSTDKVPKLNASAAAFTPSCVVAPPAILAPAPSRPVVTPYRSKYAALSNKGADKNGVTITRQPRGPAPDEELDTKNFASRIRRRAIGAIFRGRLSFIAAEEE